MNLTVLDRIVLFSVLPEKETFATMRAVKDLRLALTLTTEERQQAGYREDEEGAGWESDFEANIPIDPDQFAICRKALEALSAKGEITLNHLGLYEKFVERPALVEVT